MASVCILGRYVGQAQVVSIGSFLVGLSSAEGFGNMTTLNAVVGRGYSEPMPAVNRTNHMLEVPILAEGSVLYNKAIEGLVSKEA